MPHLIRFTARQDSRGLLTIAERELPFVPARIFWVTNADDKIRGGHRHKRTEMLLAVLHGRVDIEVQSPTSSAHFVLASPDIGLHLAPEDWHRMRFGRAAVLLVIASLGYDPDDYITEPYAHGR